jgi:predicted amidophosphoribosyltransferase
MTMTITKLASLNKLNNWRPVEQLEPVGKKPIIPDEICSVCNHSLEYDRNFDWETEIWICANCNTEFSVDIEIVRDWKNQAVFR